MDIGVAPSIDPATVPTCHAGNDIPSLSCRLTSPRLARPGFIDRLAYDFGVAAAASEGTGLSQWVHDTAATLHRRPRDENVKRVCGDDWPLKRSKMSYGKGGDPRYVDVVFLRLHPRG